MTTTVTLAEIKHVQEKLIALHEEIQTIRRRMAPIQEEMEQAYQEYQASIRPLYIRSIQLEMEIEARQQAEHRDNSTQDEGGDFASVPEGEEKNTPKKSETNAPGPTSITQSQEATWKDEFLEFVFWVLDDQTDEKNRVLTSLLTEMNEKSSVTLADMLEQIPSELYLEQRWGDEDNLSAWYARLQSWQEALTRRLERVKQEEIRLYSGQKHTLWQQYRHKKETGGWQKFLDTQRSQFQARIQQLEAQLRHWNGSF